MYVLQTIFFCYSLLYIFYIELPQYYMRVKTQNSPVNKENFDINWTLHETEEFIVVTTVPFFGKSVFKFVWKYEFLKNWLRKMVTLKQGILKHIKYTFFLSLLVLLWCISKLLLQDTKLTNPSNKPTLNCCDAFNCCHLLY